MSERRMSERSRERERDQNKESPAALFRRLGQRTVPKEEGGRGGRGTGKGGAVCVRACVCVRVCVCACVCVFV